VGAEPVAPRGARERARSAWSADGSRMSRPPASERCAAGNGRRLHGLARNPVRGRCSTAHRPDARSAGSSRREASARPRRVRGRPSGGRSLAAAGWAGRTPWMSLTQRRRIVGCLPRRGGRGRRRGTAHRAPPRGVQRVPEDLRRGDALPWRGRGRARRARPAQRSEPPTRVTGAPDRTKLDWAMARDSGKRPRPRRRACSCTNTRDESKRRACPSAGGNLGRSGARLTPPYGTDAGTTPALRVCRSSKSTG